MECRKGTTGNRGFALLVVFMIMSAVTIGLVMLAQHAFKGAGKNKVTAARMETIAAKARQYYRSHKAQAKPVKRKVGGNKTTWSVPVGSAGLNLESKYRMDGWGHFLYYQICDPVDSKDISGFDLKNSSVKYGAVIISSGPDQMFGIKNSPDNKKFVLDITDEDGNFNLIYFDSSDGKCLAAVTKSDDIIYWISFNQEATEITLEELQVLQRKVKAFDAQFEGVDNNGSDGIDESGCVADSGSTCPPIGNNDPNCGRATLDNITSYDCGSGTGVNETASAIAFIVDRYNLSINYLVDSWGNPYSWSDTDPSNPKYHRFWSSGPDGIAGTDDDIVY